MIIMVSIIAVIITIRIIIKIINVIIIIIIIIIFALISPSLLDIKWTNNGCGHNLQAIVLWNVAHLAFKKILLDWLMDS